MSNLEIFIAHIATGIVCLFTGYRLGKQLMREEAVKNNAGEWIVKNSIGETKFSWKTGPKAKD